MRRVLMIGLFLLLILLVGVAPLAYADDPVIIRPWQNGQVFEVPAGQEIIIRNSWADCSPKDVRMFQIFAVESLELNGLTDMTSYGRYWNTPYPMDPPPDPDCARLFQGTMWRSDWLYPLGTLEVGTYDAHFDSFLRRGYYLWPPGCGAPDCTVQPGDVDLHVDFTIVVVEP